MSHARDLLSTRGTSRLFAALTVPLLVATPQVARACSVCFGNPDSPHTQGMANAILFLLAIIGGVLVGFAAFFLHLRKMSRMAGMARVGDAGVIPRRGSLPGASSGGELSGGDGTTLRP